MMARILAAVGLGAVMDEATDQLLRTPSGKSPGGLPEDTADAAMRVLAQAIIRMALRQYVRDQASQPPAEEKAGRNRRRANYE